LRLDADRAPQLKVSVGRFESPRKEVVMFHLASLATMFVLVLPSAPGLGSRGQIRDCPAASLSCEKSAKKDSEYICRVDAPQASQDGFKWSVTAGKVMDCPSEATRIIDVGGVDAESVTVTVAVKWKLPGCYSSVSAVLKLR